MILYFKGTAYDLPHQKGYTMNRTIDSSFDSALVTLLLRDIYGDLDVTRRLPRDLIVEIDGFRFRTGETNVDKLNENGDYKHTVNLVSMSKIFTRMPLENIAVTQPQGDLGTYNRSVNVLDNTELENFSFYYDVTSDYSGIEVFKYETDTIPFENAIITNASIVDELDIISLEAYSISLKFIAYSVIERDDTSVTFRIKYNGSTIKTSTFGLGEATTRGLLTIPSRLSQAITFNYTPTVTGTLSVEVEVNSNDTIIDYAFLSDTALSITAVETVDKPIRTYAQLVDKILRHQGYVLDAYSRERLNITAPEEKFENYTIYDALAKVGGYNSSLLRVYDEINERYWKSASTGSYDIEGDSVYDYSPYEYDLDTRLKVGSKYYVNTELDTLVREVGFEWFDNPSVKDMPYTAYTEKAELEDYVAGVQLTTKNVLKQQRYSPMKGVFKGIRTTDIGQQTTDNVVYECEDEIERPIQVLVKGRAGHNIDETITYSESDVTDITSRVVNEKYYNTLSDEKDLSYSGKIVLRKHNTIYFTQGDNFLKGLSYLGENKSLVIGDEDYKRAIYEVIDAVRSEEKEERIYGAGDSSDEDEGIPGDLKLLFQVKYQNITETHARVYKDDISGFEQETIKYMNESANINEAGAIGDYAQQIVNRLGGTKVIIQGQCDSYDDLPNLGDVDSQGRVYTIINTQKNKTIKYTITLVQDYNVINSLIGINSRLRFEEISSSDETSRMLRYPSRFIFTPTQETFSTRWILSEDMLDHLYNNPTEGINYAYIEFNQSNGQTSKVHASVDTYAEGRTLQVQIQMKDNYSAGLQRYSKVIDTETVYFNRDVSYTDYYGKVNDISVYMYYDSTLLDSDMATYPEATETKGGELVTVITDYIDKDARERIGILGEISFFSQDDEIIVFNGFAKFNKLVENDKTIATGLLKYIPPKNAKIADLSLIRDMNITGSYSFGEFNLSWNAPTSGQGIVWYEQDSLELIMAYIKPISSGAGSDTKYYKIEEDVHGGGYSIVSIQKIDLKVNANVEIDNASILDISHTVYLSEENLRGVIVEATIGLNTTSNVTLDDASAIDITKTLYLTSSVILGSVNSLNKSLQISAVVDLASDSSLNISRTANISLDYDTPIWIYTTDTAYDETVTHIASGSTCGTIPAILSWVKDNYSANEKGLGYILRVARTNENFGLCIPNYYYFKVV